MSVIVPADHQPNWGPSGSVVYSRTYSRPKPDGSKETWNETVQRVVLGNLALVYGDDTTQWSEGIKMEAQELYDHIYDFKILPAGRHLWATGVKGRSYLFNCHHSGWGDKLSTHFDFTFMRLMEGGGVGANYSTKFLTQYGAPKRQLNLHIVADEDHKDFELLKPLLSDEYSPDWEGAFRIEDSREGWSAALTDLIDTFYADDVEHKDRVYDVSLVRPRGAKLKQFGGTASGPVPLAELLGQTVATLNAVYLAGGNLRPLDAMDIDHAIGACVVAGGVRRSARMSIVRWDDPDVFKFIEAKKDFTKHWTTNISVEIDNEFISLINDEMHDINKIDGGRRHWAKRVHSAVVAGMLENGEPGYWNSDLSNVGELNRVDSTNPCGEIALEAFENCNLGHVNLEAFATGTNRVDHDAILKAHKLTTRMLMRATFGDVTDPKQREILNKNRRIGVGHLGVQGFLNKTGIRYSDAPKSSFPDALDRYYQAVRQEARDYAFQLRIPEPVKVTAIAPTGSIAKLPGVTEGIHPIYAKYFIRRIRFSKLRDEELAQVEAARQNGNKVVDDIYAANTSVVEFPTVERLVQEVVDLGYDEELVESVDEIALDKMLEFQKMYQTHYADNAVSFTVNFPEGQYMQGYVEKALGRHLTALKGTTLMPDGSRALAPYERVSRAYIEGLADGSISVDESFDEACQSGACPIR